MHVLPRRELQEKRNRLPNVGRFCETFSFSCWIPPYCSNSKTGCANRSSVISPPFFLFPYGAFHFSIWVFGFYPGFFIHFLNPITTPPSIDTEDVSPRGHECRKWRRCHCRLGSFCGVLVENLKERKGERNGAMMGTLMKRRYEQNIVCKKSATEQRRFKPRENPSKNPQGFLYFDGPK